MSLLRFIATPSPKRVNLNSVDCSLAKLSARLGLDQLGVIRGNSCVSTLEGNSVLHATLLNCSIFSVLQRSVCACGCCKLSTDPLACGGYSGSHFSTGETAGKCVNILTALGQSGADQPAVSLCILAVFQKFGCLSARHELF